MNIVRSPFLTVFVPMSFYRIISHHHLNILSFDEGTSQGADVLFRMLSIVQEEESLTTLTTQFDEVYARLDLVVVIAVSPWTGR